MSISGINVKDYIIHHDSSRLIRGDSNSAIYIVDFAH